MTFTQISKFFVFILITTLIHRGRLQNRGDSANPLSVGGSYIPHGECPWLCPLYYQSPNKKPEYFCGTSLISNQYVVTAAHCIQDKGRATAFSPSYLSIYVGVYDLDSQLDQNIIVNRVQKIKIHPTWDVSSERYDADIALIKMTESVSFSDYIQRIALPASSFIQNSVEGYVAGYGKSESDRSHETKPRKIKIPIVGVEECYQNHEVFSRIKSRDSFCAGRPGVVPCNGDSGGSFYLLQKTTPVLLGIVSVGVINHGGKCKDDAYAAFTDVVKFVDWIKKEVGSGYLLSDSKGSSSTNWKTNDAFCEFVVDDAYRCTLRGVRSPTNDVKITGVHGTHKEHKDDDDVVKMWIIEQDAKFIPEMSEVEEKFKQIHDLRIWTCGLKYIERSKLAIFAKRLRVLDFFNNHIEEIPADAFDDLLRLEELKILNNQVKHLPENLFHNLKNLKYFFAENNEIEELPEHLFDHTQIVSVVMKNNLLKNILVNFRKFRNVNVIDFHQNTCIDQCLGHYCGKMSVNEMQREIGRKCYKTPDAIIYPSD